MTRHARPPTAPNPNRRLRVAGRGDRQALVAVAAAIAVAVTGCASTPHPHVDIGMSRVGLNRAFTNADGRTDRPLLEGDAFTRGVYEIEFGAGAYFARSGATLSDPPFVGDVVLRVGVANSDEHYHVPLLMSPWSYSTYRGG